MRDLGNDIEIVPRGEGRTPDFKINGKQFELKTVSGIKNTEPKPLSGSISNRILNGLSQSADVIIDARKQIGINSEVAKDAASRAFGADTKRGLNSVTILTQQGTVFIPRK